MFATDASAWSSLPAMFFAQADRLGDRPLFWAKHGGAYTPIPWSQAARTVAALSQGLKALGVGPGDRVVLVADNRPEWGLADLAVMTLGAATVPAYTTNTTADHRHILVNSGAKVAIVSSRALADRLLPAVAEAPELACVVALEPVAAQAGGKPVHAWADIVARGGADAARARADAARLGRADLCCIIYTSGTGGVPKGVMLSHGAILHNCHGARRLFDAIGLDDEVFLSFLPLSHAYEHMAGLMFPLVLGAQVYYAEGINDLARNMQEARPTIMTCVPRLYEVMRARMEAQVKRQGGLPEKLFDAALALGRRAYRRPLARGPVERTANWALERLVRDKIRARFGGRLKAFVSGGAPLNPDLGLFFVALGVRLLQGYGQTESAPVISVNLPERNKLETVGPPIAATEVRIAPDGEILVRGENVMLGYWRDPEATRNAIRDGWLHTGDVGRFDEDGHLLITDRKKDIIVNSGGDNVAPQRVEGILLLEPEIEQVAVFGDKRPHLVALVVPSAERLKALGVDPADAAAVHDLMGKAIERANRGLSPIEKVRRFALAPEPFTIENGLMTATLKVRRAHVYRKHQALIDGLYG